MSKKQKIDTTDIDLAKPVEKKPDEYVVAQGKSVTGIIGQINAGQTVSARDFKNGQKTLSFYVEKKAVILK